MASIQKDFTFHENVTITSTGKELTINNSTSVIIEIVATDTFTVQFEAKGKGNSWKPLIGANVSSPSIDIVTATSDKTAFWQVDIIGFQGFRVNLTANGGTTTVYGKIIK